MTDWLEKLSNKQVLTVSQLNNSAKRTLEQQFDTVWVEGEISNFSRPASGHWYFTLKDESAQIRCAMFRGKNSRLKFTPSNGDSVVLRGSLSLYAARGDYQLIADNLTDAGTGALQRAFDELKAKLQNQGWFAEERKQPLPTRPQEIAVITSATGAVWHDIQTCVARRNPFVTLTLLPVAVQGSNAIQEICRAIETTQNHEFDAIIVARGGGSLEDLAAFNSLEVATAIHHCTTPVVAGVGHETDFSIAEFVADQRAATPTAAAEILTPDLQHDITYTQQLLVRAGLQLKRQSDELRHKAHALERRLKHPKAVIDEQRIATDRLALRLQNAMQTQFDSASQISRHSCTRLKNAAPSKTVALQQAKLDHLCAKLHPAFDRHYSTAKQQLTLAMTTLGNVSPLATLDRGYSIVQQGKSVITSVNDVAVNSDISIRFHDGELKATVNDSASNPPS